MADGSLTQLRMAVFVMKSTCGSSVPMNIGIMSSVISRWNIVGTPVPVPINDKSNGDLDKVKQMKKVLKSNYSELFFLSSPTGVEPMTFQDTGLSHGFNSCYVTQKTYFVNNWT